MQDDATKIWDVATGSLIISASSLPSAAKGQIDRKGSKSGLSIPKIELSLKAVGAPAFSPDGRFLAVWERSHVRRG
jgi:hypothetical protein